MREDGAVGKDSDRERGLVQARRLYQQRGFGLGFDIQPLVRHLVTRQELADGVRFRRPAVPDDADPFEWWPEAGLPVAQQIVEHRVESLFGWVPRLHQVVVQADFVDGPDRRLGVGVRGQKDTLDFGIEADRFGEELDAGLPGHALVDQEQRDRVVSQLEALHGRQRGRAGIRAHDPVILPIPAAQVALHRGENRPVVIHCKDYWLWHGHSH